MDFNRDWTPFALDAEVDHFGTMRIAKAHNALRKQLAAVRRDGVIEGLKRALDWHNITVAWAQQREQLEAEIERAKGGVRVGIICPHCDSGPIRTGEYRLCPQHEPLRPDAARREGRIEGLQDAMRIVSSVVPRHTECTGKAIRLLEDEIERRIREEY